MRRLCCRKCRALGATACGNVELCLACCTLQFKPRRLSAQLPPPSASSVVSTETVDAAEGIYRWLCTIGKVRIDYPSSACALDPRDIRKYRRSRGRSASGKALSERSLRERVAFGGAVPSDLGALLESSARQQK